MTHELENSDSATHSLAACTRAVANADFCPFLEPELTGPSAVSQNAGFAIFLAATATLICRPADLFPLLHNIPIYEIIMIACLAVSMPRVMHQFFSRSLAAWPITRLIFGIFVAIVISHLKRGSLSGVRSGGGEFLKIFLYYLVLLAWVDSPTRMRHFLLCLCACVLVLTISALAQYNGLIDLPALQVVRQAGEDSGTVLIRLCSTGIFHDPNDLCLVLVIGIAICFYFTGDKRMGWLRFGWLFLIALFGYAMMLTYSRGGFLALLGLIGAVFVTRYGWKRATLVSAVLVPIMLILFAGRQTHVDLSNPEDTFQTRLDLWSNSLTLFGQYPIFGAGESEQVAQFGQVAHNSFIQSYAELGLFGGAMFLGAFAISIAGVYQSPPAKSDLDLVRLRPYLVGAVAGYAVALFSLSRAYTVPTYLVIGLAAAYVNLLGRPAIVRLNSRLAMRLGQASLLLLLATYVFVRVMSVSGK